MPPTLLVLALLSLAACRTEPEKTDDTGLTPTDVDGDGYDSLTDCDDADAGVHPDATEACNGIDDDCDGEVDEGAQAPWYADADADGYGDLGNTIAACEAPSGYVADATDCDDTDAAIFPGAAEVCDGIDQDCDGEVDEGVTSTWYSDADGDGWGDTATAAHACEPASGQVAIDGDCDDGDPAFHPGATEDDCTDPNDYNCDGSVGYADTDVDGWAACTDCDDGDAAINPDATELCNGLDDDCDGSVDEDDAADAPTWHADADADGYGDAATTAAACSQPTGYVADATDCDDTSAAINPAATELCNGLDDDCDALTDDDDPDVADQPSWYADADADGYGDAATAAAACTQPSGYVPDATDCDDATAAINPAATELCNGVDDDCDGTVDEDAASDAPTWYADTDGDSYGDAASTTAACSQPSGYVSDATDCDDTAGVINPAATELCDGLDNDCDGIVDEPSAADAPTWYLDVDSDGYGDASATTAACTQPTGYVSDATDCDDGDPAVNPGAAESCNGTDDDCDGVMDEDDAVDTLTWYADGDADTFGDAASTTAACAQPAGYVADDTDCDDGVAAINPAATEVCDGLDDDCDGLVDDDDPGVTGAPAWYADADRDSYGDAAAGAQACTAPSGHVSDATDCDDADPAINPGATEICNGLDDDCDGTVDGPGAADAITWYMDADGDGYGDASSPVVDCSEPSGAVNNDDDCDDTDPAAYPGALETLDGDDDDCDGDVDEAIVATVFASQCLDQDGHATLTAAESTQAESDRVEDYLADMGFGMDRYDEVAGAGTGAALEDYELVLWANCGWSWISGNQTSVDELLDARDLGIPTFVWGDDIGWICSNVSGEEELTLMEGCYANGTAATVTMTGASHVAYNGPYGIPVDFAYAQDMDQVISWGGATVLAYSSAYGSGSPVWSVYEDSTNGSRAASLEPSIFMSNHAQVTAAAEVELEIVFKNSVCWLLDL
ncbi:MAG: putative metal-binding motif-containing protein [Pseudomonadota bacterium]